MVKANQVATEHTPALDDAPPPELLAAQRDLLELWTQTKGFPPKIVQKGVLQAITSYFPDFQCGQSEPARSQRSTTGLVQAGATERQPDLENHAPALAPDNTRGSQDGNKSPRDATGGVLVRGERPASRVARPGGADLAEQVAASSLRVKRKRKSKPTGVKKQGKSNPTRLNLKDLNKIPIEDEQDFGEAFEKYGLDAIRADRVLINLLDLARETVKVAKREFLARQRQHRGQDRALGEVNMTHETWQVLFTIVANMFVYGLEPLYNTVKALSTGSDEPESNDAVDRPLSEGNLFTVFDKETMEKLSELMRCWRGTGNKKEAQLNKVYAYYKKLQAVRLYDELIESWEEHEGPVQEWAQYHLGRRLDAATLILNYIGKQITQPRKEDTNNNLEALAEDSSIAKELSGYIFGFRPICALVDTFGEGVLVLLIDRAEKYVPGKMGEGQEHYPQHQRIRDMAQALLKVDREQHRGRLRRLFTDLEKKVLRPVVQYCGPKGGDDAPKFLHDSPGPRIFNLLHVGQKISHILNLIVESGHTGSVAGSDTGSDVITAQERQPRGLSKRRTRHDSMQEAVDGEDGRSKRRRTESNEDEEARQDGSESNNDSEEDRQDGSESNNDSEEDRQDGSESNNDSEADLYNPSSADSE